jgi:phosphatidylglycerophosphate synthase
MELTLDEVKRAAKREDFRAGVQMRLLMPRLSVRVTRWILSWSDVRPDQITVVSFIIGLAATACFMSANPLMLVLGLLGFHLHVLLDYVDGEVARCRGTTSVSGAYFDLITDRITFPLFIFCSGLGVFGQFGDPTILIVAFFATFGLYLDKFAVDCWYRANSGAPEVEDRYVEAPARSFRGVWFGRAKLLVVMARGMTAFLTYTVIAGFLDSMWAFPMASIGSFRAAVLWIFAPTMIAGAIARFLYVYFRGSIPRRQALL